MHSYLKAQLSPTLGFLSATIASTPSALSLAASTMPLQAVVSKHLLDPLAVGTPGADHNTHAFPPPMIKTSVSMSSEPVRSLPGDVRRPVSAGKPLNSSSQVERIQIFHSNAPPSSPSLAWGSNVIRPLHAAPGAAVSNLKAKLIHCYTAHKTHITCC